MQRFLLRPVLRLWAHSRSTSVAAVPRPEDAPVARVAGPDQHRILLLGSGAAAGWGVRSHDLALPGQLARCLASRTGRGAQVDARVHPSLRMAGLSQLLPPSTPVEYDAVVVVGGMHDAVTLTPLEQWTRGVERVIDAIRERVPGAEILVVGVQPVRSVGSFGRWPGPVAERHRERLNRITRRVCAEQHLAYTPLPAPMRPPSRPGHRSPTAYREWAEAISGPLADLLDRDRPPRRGAQHEPDRQRAVDAVLADTEPAGALDRIAELARSTFGVSTAAVTVLDGGLQRFRSIAGGPPDPIPRDWSLCATTVQSDGALVVGDLSRDPRFAATPLVEGAAGLRFYAGYPVESPDGYRIGALCVFDTDPRDGAEIDVDRLSELALMAQKELWNAAARTRAG